LIPLTDRISPHFNIYDCTQNDGRYILKDIPTGKYLLASTTNNDPYGDLETQVLPVVHMGVGDILENHDFFVVSHVTVSGILLNSDGEPAASQIIEFKADVNHEGLNVDASASTDSDGRFSIKILKGLSGQLYGRVNLLSGEYSGCPNLDRMIQEYIRFESEIIITGDKLRIIADTDLDGVVLKLPIPGCR
jgi:hypothetical protein